MEAQIQRRYICRRNIGRNVTEGVKVEYIVKSAVLVKVKTVGESRHTHCL